ncbi:MAG: hypothetical protein ABR598_07790, partial [Candidatus Dormibacteria bacterium]
LHVDAVAPLHIDPATPAPDVAAPIHAGVPGDLHLDPASAPAPPVHADAPALTHIEPSVPAEVHPQVHLPLPTDADAPSASPEHSLIDISVLRHAGVLQPTQDGGMTVAPHIDAHLVSGILNGDNQGADPSTAAPTHIPLDPTHGTATTPVDPITAPPDGTDHGADGASALTDSPSALHPGTDVPAADTAPVHGPGETSHGLVDGTPTFHAGTDVSPADHVVHNADGTLTTVHPDGSTSTAYPSTDGMTLTWNSDGTTVASHPEAGGGHTDVVLDGHGHATVIHYDASGMETGREAAEMNAHGHAYVAHNADGTTTDVALDGKRAFWTYDSANGTSEHHFGDGNVSVVHELPGGGEVLVTAHPNGDVAAGVQRADGTWEPVQHLKPDADGNVIVNSPDGTHLVLHPDGSASTSYPSTDGMTLTWNSDGTSVASHAEAGGGHTDVVLDGHGHATVVHYDASGREVGREDADTSANGRHEAHNADGTVTQVYADGKTAVWTYDSANGTTEHHFSDGNTTVAHKLPDGGHVLITTHPNGDVATGIARADGTQGPIQHLKPDADGNVVVNSPDGTQLVLHPDGSASTIQDFGNGISTESRSDGSVIGHFTPPPPAPESAIVLHADGTATATSHDPSGASMDLDVVVNKGADGHYEAAVHGFGYTLSLDSNGVPTLTPS